MSAIPTPKSPVILVRHCEDAREFIDLLSPRSELFFHNPRRHWLWRGHANAEFELVPSALRANSEALSYFRGSEIKTTESQILAEATVLEEFFNAADRGGLPIPEDTQRLRRSLIRDEYMAHPWPPDDLLTLMALAQHHGLPTRLLDWSWNPYKAAFFAASGAYTFRDAAEPNKLAVWAIDTGIVEDFIFDEADEPFALVTAPTYSNANLRAQEGVFIRTPRVTYNPTPIDRRSINEIVETEMKGSELYSPSLMHITLPVKQSGGLLYLLAEEGVTRVRLFPDYYGVVQGMRDARRWHGGVSYF